MKKLISISLLAFIASLFVLAATPDAVFDGDVSLTSITNASDITIESTGAGVNVNIHSDAGDDFAVDTDKLVVGGDNGRVGIGTSSPDGKLHVHTASAGSITATANYDDLTIENSGSAGISILTPNNAYGGIMFGDPDDADVASIQYDHDTNKMYIETNDSNAIIIDSSGDVGIGLTNPVAKFEVAMAGSDTVGTSFIRLADSSNTGSIWFGWRLDNTSKDLFLDRGYSGNSYNVLSVDRSSGYVGIGTASPDFKLEMEAASGTLQSNVKSLLLSNGEVASWRAEGTKTGGSGVPAYASIGVRYNSSSTSDETCGYIFLDSSDNGNNYLWTDDSDLLRISTDTSHVGSTSGTVVGDQSSDIRLKQSVTPIKDGLAEVLQLEPIEFKYKEGRTAEKRLGFSAQQVQPILPEVVYDTKDEIEDEEGDIDEKDGKKKKHDKLAMRYAEIVPVLVKAIQEQQVQIEALKSRIEQLENKE